mmetsp:Transcript_28074/g.38987  ORF Transcript_28074/g.38987 Transcript_28074/m.38987 type:complete len:121 (+) Transcript_28074:2019-2381(+)
MVVSNRWNEKIKLNIPPRTNSIDNKCPFYGKVALRGRIIKGTVFKTKMNRSVVVKIEYLKPVVKYHRFIKRHKNISCHISNLLSCRVGDKVIISECRPLSKTIRFVVIKVLRSKRNFNKQ